MWTLIAITRPSAPTFLGYLRGGLLSVAIVGREGPSPCCVVTSAETDAGHVGSAADSHYDKALGVVSAVGLDAATSVAESAV